MLAWFLTKSQVSLCKCAHINNHESRQPQPRPSVQKHLQEKVAHRPDVEVYVQNACDVSNRITNLTLFERGGG
jgi:hypothetical protein